MQPQNVHAKTLSRAGVYQATANQAQQEQKKANADPLGQNELVVRVRIGVQQTQASLVNALVDTGAQLSMVTWSLVHQLGLAAWVRPIPVAIAAISRDGSHKVHRITHKIELILTMSAGVLGVHEFLINPDPRMSTSVAVPLVFGWDFARAFCLNIDWKRRAVKFKPMKPFATIADNAVKAAAAAAARRSQIIAEGNKYGIPNIIMTGRRLKGILSPSANKVKKQVSFDGKLPSSPESSTRKHRHGHGHSPRHLKGPASSAKYAALVLLGLAARGRQRRSAAPSPESARSSSLGVSQASRRGHIFDPEFKVVETVQADGTRKKVIIAKEKVKGAEQRRA
ncbi:hypothetical protein BCR35DRAFT_349168 [Leucosporidium creatinivorum]|uniref:Uncharacterized protein n=1 Tax=Leucosporidium creatinivorum TaxID=106004 RepID=A0A1Y2G4H8_9BASI|nr:hypothetical protein BCR35DRAFT_349168 [Leucosporidium creatinivorum]